MKASKKAIIMQNPLVSGSIQYLKNNTGIIVGFFLICTILSIANPNFLTGANMLNILKQISTNALLAFGMTFIILIGGIDLSVGSILAFAGIATTSLIANWGVPVVFAVLIGIALSALLGLFNGFLAAKTSIPPFIITLSMYSMARGGAYLLCNGQPIRVFDDSFNIIGNGFLGPVAFPVIYTVIIFIILMVVLKFTRFGRYVYAVGGNAEAALYSGIRIQKIKMIVFCLSGVLAGISGIVLSARMYTGQPSVGQGSELDAIAAVVLGGTSFSGGIGSLGGTILGALMIGVINNGLNLLNVSSFLQLVAKGAVILLAVYLDTIKKRDR